ncbi:MAG: hypothetical protein ACTSXZ_10830 [Alphaproteobacteria bacterium]
MDRRPFPVSVLLAAILGGVLVWTAAPRFLSGIYLSAIREGPAPLTPEAAKDAHALARAERALGVAVAAHEDGRDWARLGGVRLALAEGAGFDTPRGQALLTRADAALVRGLALAPAQPYAWTQLLQARLRRDGVTAKTSRLLRMAIRTGPSEPSLVLTRVDIGLLAWRRLDMETRAALAAQIRLAARRNPADLARLTRRRYALAPVRAALAGTPMLHQRFDDTYRRLKAAPN